MFMHTQHRPDAWKYEPASIGGRHVVITGGTTGIGRTTALLLASLGARVLIFGRHQQPLNDALQSMGDEYRERVVGITADVSREEEVDRVFDEVDRQLGSLDILINNAGLPASSVVDMPPQDYRYVIETNLTGYIACAKRAIPRLKQRGGGMIINIGSLSAKGMDPGSDVYTATKAGLRGFSESISKQLQQENIRVTLIEPGQTGADLHPTPPEQERQMHEQGSLLYSEAVAEAVAWCLTVPMPCHVPLLQIQPVGEVIGE